MQNTKDLDREVERLLDVIGGEPLTQSGFENEDPDGDFRSEDEG